jgi:lipoprotein-anchoring transpeptidase ErfK/SrfK
MTGISRRDFLKLSTLALSGLAFSPFVPEFNEFDDSQLGRVTISSVSVYSQPSDKSRIVGQWFKDEIVHLYEQVTADEPEYNPVWYRVWGGYLHRAHIQKVRVLYNQPLSFIPEDARRLAEVTVPFTLPWRFTKTYGWQQLKFNLYYQTVCWIEAVEEGPDGQPWYWIYDEEAGSYQIRAIHLRPIPDDELTPLSPEVPAEEKRIEVNLSTQTLMAYEYGNTVLETKISSGLPGKTSTSRGRFDIDPKTASKHMGNGNLFAGVEDYELPGVPWTSFFTGDGQAFHGTYWHDNFGTPMSHGCVNMRTEEAKWLFRWSTPSYQVSRLLDRNADTDIHGLGTVAEVHY